MGTLTLRRAPQKGGRFGNFYKETSSIDFLLKLDSGNRSYTRKAWPQFCSHQRCHKFFKGKGDCNEVPKLELDFLIMGRNLILLILFGLLLSMTQESQASSSSDSLLRKVEFTEEVDHLVTLHQENREQLRSLGLENPSLILGLMGPRFFDPEAWSQAQQKELHPGNIYKPVTTWAHWVRTEMKMEEVASANRKAGAIAIIDRNWLKNLYADAMGISIEKVEFRKEDILGLALVTRNRLSAEEFGAVQNSKIDSSGSLRFFPTRCDADFPTGVHHFREISSEQLKALILPEDSSVLQGQLEHNAVCGFFLYPEVEEVEKLLDQWILDFNKAVSENYFEDPYIQATRLARALVIIHPFPDGNGRLSRFIQDYLLLSKGLPPPIFTDMNKDFIRTPEQWAQEMKAGSFRYLQIQKNCLDQWSHLAAILAKGESLSYECSALDLKKLVPRTSQLPGGRQY